MRATIYGRERVAGRPWCYKPRNSAGNNYSASVYNYHSYVSSHLAVINSRLHKCHLWKISTPKHMVPIYQLTSPSTRDTKEARDIWRALDQAAAETSNQCQCAPLFARASLRSAKFKCSREYYAKAFDVRWQACRHVSTSSSHVRVDEFAALTANKANTQCPRACCGQLLTLLTEMWIRAKYAPTRGMLLLFIWRLFYKGDEGI